MFDVHNGDRELELVVTSLQRLAVQVEAHFNPDSTEGADLRDAAADAALSAYARQCLQVLDDPGVTSRLLSVYQSRW